VLLQHGSLPLHDDQSAVAALLAEPGAAAAEAPPATLAGVLGREPAWEELTAALAAGWEEALDAVLVPGALTDAERAAAQAAAERYAAPAWTWHQ